MNTVDRVRRLRSDAPLLSVGLLTADWLNLGEALALLERGGAQLVHVDVMDGEFCPMMTLGPPMIKALRTPLLKDVHLMIHEPLDKVEQYVAAGADIVTIQAESTKHPHRVLQALGTMQNVNDSERGIIRGAALNPGTPLSALGPLMDELELILLLAINPGWGGQKFIPATCERLAAAREMIRHASHDILLMIDGGITRHNIAEVAAMEPDVIVTGSAVFDGKSPAENLVYMQNAIGASARGAVGGGKTNRP